MCCFAALVVTSLVVVAVGLVVGVAVIEMVKEEQAADCIQSSVVAAVAVAVAEHSNAVMLYSEFAVKTSSTTKLAD